MEERTALPGQGQRFFQMSARTGEVQQVSKKDAQCAVGKATPLAMLNLLGDDESLQRPLDGLPIDAQRAQHTGRRNQCIGNPRPQANLLGNLNGLVAQAHPVGGADGGRAHCIGGIARPADGKGRQARSQPRTVLQRPQKPDGLLDIARALHRIAAQIGHQPQQIEGLGQARPVVQRLKDRQRLLMAAQGFLGLSYIEIPVSQPVQRAGQSRRRLWTRPGWPIQAAGRFQCPLKIDARLRVIPRCPQLSQVEEKLPFPLPGRGVLSVATAVSLGQHQSRG